LVCKEAVGCHSKLRQDLSDLELNVSEQYVKKVDISRMFQKIERSL
jgi:hypothetical protein